MQNVTLTLKPYHLAQLREAVRARNVVVKNDTTSTVTDRAVCADLENRIDLLAQAVATEFAAKEARRKYDKAIQTMPQLSGHRKRQQARKLTEQEPPQDLPDLPDIPAPEPPAANPATVIKRPI